MRHTPGEVQLRKRLDAIRVQIDHLAGRRQTSGPSVHVNDVPFSRSTATLSIGGGEGRG